MGNTCCARKKKPRKIVLLLVGLDNAGKTVAARSLSGDPIGDSIAPTVGFSLIKLKYSKYDVHIFDLGGGSNIRSIWDRYFVDAHGIMFVVDSSDLDRLPEVHNVLTDILAHDKVRRKPLLLLANKQDDENALDEIDLVEKLHVEALVNAAESPTFVETCCARLAGDRGQIDEGIVNGYNWLMRYVIKNYEALNARVETDVLAQLEAERVERIAKVERIYANRSKLDTSDDIIELYSEYKNKHLNGIAHALAPDQSPAVMTAVSSVVNSPASSRPATPPSLQKHKQDAPKSSRVLRNIINTERPKSATALVRNQLELDNLHRRKNRRNLLNRNKTSPANIFGAQTARESSKPSSLVDKSLSNGRSLRSAGDSVFVRPETSPSQLKQDGLNNGGGDDLGRLFKSDVFIRPHSVDVRLPINNVAAINDASTNGNARLKTAGQLTVVDVE